MPWIVRRTVFVPRAGSRDASSPCSASRFHSVRCLIGMLVPWSRASFCAAAKAALGIEQQVVFADPAEPLTVRTPVLPLVVAGADDQICQPQQAASSGAPPSPRRRHERGRC